MHPKWPPPPKRVFGSGFVPLVSCCLDHLAYIFEVVLLQAYKLGLQQLSDSLTLREAMSAKERLSLNQLLLPFVLTLEVLRMSFSLYSLHSKCFIDSCISLTKLLSFAVQRRNLRLRRREFRMRRKYPGKPEPIRRNKLKQTQWNELRATNWPQHSREELCASSWPQLPWLELRASNWPLPDDLAAHGIVFEVTFDNPPKQEKKGEKSTKKTRASRQDSTRHRRKVSEDQCSLTEADKHLER